MIPSLKGAPISTPETLSVQYLKGVGPRMAEKLATLGIRTVEDLLTYYPRDWEDRRQFYPLKDAKVNQETTFRGKIVNAHFAETGKGLAIVTALIEDKTGQLLLRWIRKKSFRYDVLEGFRRDLVAGCTVLAHGKINQDFGGKTMLVDEYEAFTGSEEDHIHIDRIVPIYPATEGISPRFLRKIVYDALGRTTLPDPLPKSVPAAEKLMDFGEALRKIHFPDSMPEKDEARRRLAFQELFMLQTVLALARRRRRVTRGRSYEIKKTLLTPFRERCGFEFTRSQKKVINEIFDDLTSDHPMNRLLQGDVGSGKTVVALSAMLLACENGFQSVLMAPTEILAEQHDITIRHLLEGFPVRVGLLTGSVTGAARKRFTEDCAQGKIDIAIGTHALLESDIRFKNCGLVVIDEQHRFGVQHRSKLAQRKPLPDVLVMTATPIPRTLALSLYGDLDVSTIEELPPGRQEIRTVLATETEAYAKVREEIKKGRQAYIVYPLVDESDKIELKSAIKDCERLKAGPLKNCTVGLLHGQMPGHEKEKTMKAFHEGKFQVLVATTVIEVGIDVPNATLMLIQHAERFGLSTLHQLRGRVGRGPWPSSCILIAHRPTEEAKKRLDILLATQNGFRLSEADLILRGPGEIFGTSQHGMPPFKIASFLKDGPLILQTQKIARAWVDKDPEMAAPENRALRDALRKAFAKTWFLANIA